MFCKNCGNRLDDGARFCGVCGAPVNPANGQQVNIQNNQIPGMQQNQPVTFQNKQPVNIEKPVNRQSASGSYYVSPNILLCDDGVYRWFYELSMVTNPTVLITVMKAMGLSVGITYFIILVIMLFSGNIDSFPGITVGFLITLLCVSFLTFISYYILALIKGGKYEVLFEMSETSVTHMEMPKQFEKSQAIAWLGLFSSVATGNLSGVGLNVVNLCRNSMTSTFSHVTKIKICPGRNVIYVDEGLFKNQLYASVEDFAFLEDYLRRHCPKSRIVR